MMKRKAKIYYIALDDFWRKEEKLDWIRENPISAIAFERIEPDAKNNWINQTDNDWDSLLPLIGKDVKAGKSEEAIFKVFSRGIATQRDEWVYDFSKDSVKDKMRYFVEVYEATRKDEYFADKMTIKWDRELDSYRERNIQKEFSEDQIQKSLYRPYDSKFLYFDRNFNGMTYLWRDLFRNNQENKYIAISGIGSNKNFQTLSSNQILCLDCLEKTQTLPLCTFDSENQKHENITDWALNQFQTHYKQSNGSQITKQDIFYYVYAALHSPAYRRKYEQNLKREFPRLPFYDDFFQWRDWGERLMDLHINYETVEPFALERKDADSTVKSRNKTPSLFENCLKDNDVIASGVNPTTEPTNNRVLEGDELPTTNSSPSTKEILIDTPDGLYPSLLHSSASPTNTTFTVKPKTKLRADKTNGAIEIDSHTTLTGVPPLAWEYKLGNRSALEWILDQYKERKPKDATIAERFNSYKFEDYKEHVIDLLKRVCTVSVKTMEIVNQMPEE